MKKILKRSIMLIFIILIMINIIENFIKIDNDSINLQINEYYEKSSSVDEVNIFSLKQLGINKVGVFTNVYAVVNEEGVKNENGGISIGSGMSSPVKLTFISLLGSYKLIKVTYPTDGEFYDKSLKRMFPKDIYEDLNSNSDEYNEEVSKDVKNKLKQIIDENNRKLI